MDFNRLNFCLRHRWLPGDCAFTQIQISMGQQLRKIVKRSRRKLLLKRRKEQVKLAKANPTAAKSRRETTGKKAAPKKAKAEA